jgi:hypothetical protein
VAAEHQEAAIARLDRPAAMTALMPGAGPPPTRIASAPVLIVVVAITRTSFPPLQRTEVSRFLPFLAIV